MVLPMTPDVMLTKSDEYISEDRLYSLTESLFNRKRQWESVARQIKSTNCLKINPSWISNNLTFEEESQVWLEFEIVKKLHINVVVYYWIFDCFPDLRRRRRRDRTGANHAIISIPVPVEKNITIYELHYTKALNPYGTYQSASQIPVPYHIYVPRKKS